MNETENVQPLWNWQSSRRDRNEGLNKPYIHHHTGRKVKWPQGERDWSGGRGGHDSYSEKVQSGGLAKVRNAAITNLESSQGVHKRPKVRKEQQRMSSWNRKGKQSRRWRWRPTVSGGPGRPGEGCELQPQPWAWARKWWELIYSLKISMEMTVWEAGGNSDWEASWDGDDGQ